VVKSPDSASLERHGALGEADSVGRRMPSRPASDVFICALSTGWQNSATESNSPFGNPEIHPQLDWGCDGINREYVVRERCRTEWKMLDGARRLGQRAVRRLAM
jgi:hypothetical protein